jgi:diacylglycerol kinase (ATP)
VTAPSVALAVNPTSGRGRGRRAGVTAYAHLTTSGVRVRPLHGRDGPELAEAAGQAVQAGVDALVVVGGDGMVHLGVNAVAGTTTPLGIVASGTGNDVARGLGLPVDDVLAAVTSMTPGLVDPDSRPPPVDAVRCATQAGDRWFLGVLGAGFDAIVNERANTWSRPRGHLRYDLAILRELPVFRPRQYRLVLDGHELTTSAMLVVVGNGPSYGGGMRVCPDASFDDGLVDVLVVGPMSRRRFLRLYPRVYSGRHVDHPLVEVHRARTVEIASEGIVAYGDGERLAPLPMLLTTVPGALHLLARG